MICGKCKEQIEDNERVLLIGSKYCCENCQFDCEEDYESRKERNKEDFK